MKKAIALIAMLFLAQLSTALAAKPKPPEKLTELFTEVAEIENAIRDAEWERANDIVGEVEEALTALGSSIRSAKGDQAYKVIMSEVASLRAASAQHNKVKIEIGLIDLQKEILQAMDAYDYPVHPVFEIINQYVTEASEAIEENDYDRVIHEMKDVANFVSASADTMAQKGIGKGLMNDFQVQLFVVLKAANMKNKEQSIISLKSLENTSGAFVWLASRKQ